MTLPNFDTKTFFDYARRAPFGNRLAQSQVDGIKAIFAAWQGLNPGGDDRWLAYVLATAFHETGGKMQPVREGFASTDAGARRAVAGRRYAKPDPVTGEVYYGRGLVQLTWARNYKAMGEILDLPLFQQPDFALEPSVSARILVEGMTAGASGKGDFTGKALADYFNDTVDDPVGARKIINGTDKASLIAGYHQNFLDSITAARKAVKPVTANPAGGAAPRPSDSGSGAASGSVSETAGAAPPTGLHEVADKPGLSRDQTTIGAVLAGLGGAGGIIGTVINQIANPWAFAAFAMVAVGVFLVVTGRLKIRYNSGT